MIDPRMRRCWVHTPGQAREAKDGILRTADPEIVVGLAGLFASIDE